MHEVVGWRIYNGRPVGPAGAGHRRRSILFALASPPSPPPKPPTTDRGQVGPPLPGCRPFRAGRGGNWCVGEARNASTVSGRGRAPREDLRCVCVGFSAAREVGRQRDTSRLGRFVCPPGISGFVALPGLANMGSARIGAIICRAPLFDISGYIRQPATSRLLRCLLCPAEEPGWAAARDAFRNQWNSSATSVQSGTPVVCGRHAIEQSSGGWIHLHHEPAIKRG